MIHALHTPRSSRSAASHSPRIRRRSITAVRVHGDDPAVRVGEATRKEPATIRRMRGDTARAAHPGDFGRLLGDAVVRHEAQLRARRDTTHDDRTLLGAVVAALASLGHSASLTVEHARAARVSPAERRSARTGPPRPSTHSATAAEHEREPTVRMDFGAGRFHHVVRTGAAVRVGRGDVAPRERRR